MLFITFFEYPIHRIIQLRKHSTQAERVRDKDPIPTPRFFAKFVSGKFILSYEGKNFQELRGRPTKSSNLGTSFSQIPCSTNVFVLECTCSNHLTKAMPWIKEMEMVNSVDDLKSSSSIQGICPFPDFELLDPRIASALNKIV